MSDFARSIAALAQITTELVGSFLDRIVFAADGRRDCMDVWLTQAGSIGDIGLSFERTRYLSISNSHNLDQLFVDEIDISLLSQDGTWPARAEQTVRRFDGLPELVWIELGGPLK